MPFNDIKYQSPYIPHQDYEDRIVAFIDVLGFSYMVGKSANDLARLRHLTSALDEFHNLMWEWEGDGIMGDDGKPFDPYLFDCIRKHLNEKDPVLEFLYLYQIIESFFTRIVVQDLENLIEEVQNPAGSFKDLSETLKIRKEINRWTTIEERAQIKGLEHTELDEKCRQFLACTDDKLKHPQSIYSVRNHIIHRFRVAVNQIELLDEINSLFELYLLDVLCRYTEK